jgi:hypothetical protein
LWLPRERASKTPTFAVWSSDQAAKRRVISACRAEFHKEEERMFVNCGILIAPITEAIMMLRQILERLGIYMQVSRGPLTDDEWDEIKVKPLYEAWLKHPPTENDFVDPELIDAFDRGDLSYEELLARFE